MFGIKDIERMITEYYEKCEDKKVETKISCGRVRTKDKYAPPMGNVYIDVREILCIDGELIKNPIPVDLDDMYRMVAAMLLETGFKVEDISLAVNANDPTVFEGINVTGEEIGQKDKTI